MPVMPQCMITSRTSQVLSVMPVMPQCMITSRTSQVLSVMPLMPQSTKMLSFDHSSTALSKAETHARSLSVTMTGANMLILWLAQHTLPSADLHQNTSQACWKHEPEKFKTFFFRSGPSQTASFDKDRLQLQYVYVSWNFLATGLDHIFEVTPNKLFLHHFNAWPCTVRVLTM